MRIHRLLILLFIPVIAIADPVITLQPDDWKLEKDKNGILVYTRKPAGSEYKEVKAITNIKTSLSSLVAALIDVPSHTSWIYKCEKAEVLEHVSDTEQYCYTVSDAPWPADNRDIVYQFTVSQDHTTKVVTTNSKSSPDYIPEKKKLVRVYEFNTHWIFTPLENGTVQVLYQAHINPAGIIPPWVFNMSVVAGPYKTILNLMEVVKKDQYRNARFGFIKEPAI